MKRRKFITLIGGAAMALPLTARAQQPEGMRLTIPDKLIALADEVIE